MYKQVMQVVVSLGKTLNAYFPLGPSSPFFLCKTFANKNHKKGSLCWLELDEHRFEIVGKILVANLHKQL